MRIFWYGWSMWMVCSLIRLCLFYNVWFLDVLCFGRWSLVLLFVLVCRDFDCWLIGEFVWIYGFFGSLVGGIVFIWLLVLGYWCFWWLCRVSCGVLIGCMLVCLDSVLWFWCWLLDYGFWFVFCGVVVFLVGLGLVFCVGCWYLVWRLVFRVLLCVFVSVFGIVCWGFWRVVFFVVCCVFLLYVVFGCWSFVVWCCGLVCGCFWESMSCCSCSWCRWNGYWCVCCYLCCGVCFRCWCWWGCIVWLFCLWRKFWWWGRYWLCICWIWFCGVLLVGFVCDCVGMVCRVGVGFFWFVFWCCWWWFGLGVWNCLLLSFFWGILDCLLLLFGSVCVGVLGLGGWFFWFVWWCLLVWLICWLWCRFGVVVC